MCSLLNATAIAAQVTWNPRYEEVLTTAVASPVVSAATVVSGTSMEPTAGIAAPAAVAVESAATVVPAAVTPAEAMVIPTAISITAASVISVAVAAISIVSATVIPATVVAWPVAAVVRVVPGAGADEHAADEVVRPVIAVWRAGIRIIGIVTIDAIRRQSDIVIIVITRAYPNPDRHLSLCQRSSNKKNCKYCAVFQDPHKFPQFRPATILFPGASSNGRETCYF